MADFFQTHVRIQVSIKQCIGTSTAMLTASSAMGIASVQEVTILTADEAAEINLFASKAKGKEGHWSQQFSSRQIDCSWIYERTGIYTNKSFPPTKRRLLVTSRCQMKAY